MIGTGEAAVKDAEKRSLTATIVVTPADRQSPTATIEEMVADNQDPTVTTAPTLNQHPGQSVPVRNRGQVTPPLRLLQALLPFQNDKSSSTRMARGGWRTWSEKVVTRTGDGLRSKRKLTMAVMAGGRAIEGSETGVIDQADTTAWCAMTRWA